MRILRGTLKGRKLLTFKGRRIRPTSDRVKESVFNILSDCIPGARVLDLFSGTGNLSIECISQGALSSVAVDGHPGSIELIRKNVQHLGVSDQISIKRSDVFRYLKSYKGDSFDLIFIDPPFTEKLADRVMNALSRSSAYGKETRIVIESTKHEGISDTYGSLESVDSRYYGDKLVSFFSLKKDLE